MRKAIIFSDTCNIFFLLLIIGDVGVTKPVLGPLHRTRLDQGVPFDGRDVIDSEEIQSQVAQVGGAARGEGEMGKAIRSLLIIIIIGVPQP